MNSMQGNPFPTNQQQPNYMMNYEMFQNMMRLYGPQFLAMQQQQQQFPGNQMMGGAPQFFNQMPQQQQQFPGMPSTFPTPNEINKLFHSP